ncbi:hypothetical protein [Sphingopyxis indica]|uniref:hypothetical protein n=1 Tax=Sphingopyxis indica TaxID=436663 RepID=UPI0029391AEF|nr:hypothetical protein [Sphingopyxis indica]
MTGAGIVAAHGPSADPAFIALARAWMANPSKQFVGLVWAGYADMRAAPPVIDNRDLERSITQLLEPRIRKAMSGDEPFYIQHGPYEHETMRPPPAQPPQYDLAFVLRADERIMWPLEAKIMETPKKIAPYVKDVRDEFLTCRYGPFSNSGAMLGYLLEGESADALAAIETALGCRLEPLAEHPGKPGSLSRHDRTVPVGKGYPARFDCYHLILAWPGLKRAKTDVADGARGL